jgi:hypothetical protein
MRVAGQGAPVDGLGRFLVVADAGGDHVADEEVVALPGGVFQHASDDAHVGARTVGEHHAVADLFGQLDHPPAQSGQHQRRLLAHPRHRAKLLDEAAHVGQRLALGDAEPVHGRCVADADAEAEAAARDFVDERRGAGEVGDIAGVDRRDAGAEE